MARTVEDYIKDRLFDNAKYDGDLTPVNALKRFNRYLHKLEDEIAHFVMEDFFDEGIKMDLVAGQNKYILPKGDSEGSAIPGIAEFNKLLELSIKYKEQGSGQGVQATELPVGSLQRPLEWYKDNTSTSSPYFRFDNKDIRIYPAPTSNVTDGLIIRYARTNPDVELSTLETELSIPRIYIPAILDGMTYQLQKTNKHTAVVKFYKDEWDDSRLDVLTKIGDRYAQPCNYSNPYLPNLMY